MDTAAWQARMRGRIRTLERIKNNASKEGLGIDVIAMLLTSIYGEG